MAVGKIATQIIHVQNTLNCKLFAFRIGIVLKQIEIDVIILDCFREDKNKTTEKTKSNCPHDQNRNILENIKVYRDDKSADVREHGIVWMVFFLTRYCKVINGNMDNMHRKSSSSSAIRSSQQVVTVIL